MKSARQEEPSTLHTDNLHDIIHNKEGMQEDAQPGKKEQDWLIGKFQRKPLWNHTSYRFFFSLGKHVLHTYYILKLQRPVDKVIWVFKKANSNKEG